MKSQLLLVAEDDPDDQLLIQEAIKENCYPSVDTYFVWDGAELINYLQNSEQGVGKPGLLLLDLNMPRIDGRTALREIKSNPDLASIPVAVLTTSTNDLDAQYCRQYGVVAYHRKPGSLDELNKIIRSLCMDHFGG